ncbi:MAG: hypothetical protein KIT74_03625 [Fimbriimonadales bacterium]|nr:hypothetical protein [Fimbriimonadales bacterium]
MNRMLTPIIAAAFGTIGGYFAASHQQPQIQSNIQAQSFELVDGDGAVRGRFAMTRSGPAIAMSDFQGRLRFSVGMAPGATALSMMGPAGEVAAQIMVSDSGPAISVHFPDGSPGITMKTSGDGSSTLSASDARSRSISALGVRQDGSGFLSIEEPSATQKLFLVTSGAGSNPTMSMRAGEENEAHFGFDHEGLPRMLFARPGTQGRQEVSIRMNFAEHFGLLMKTGNEQSAGLTVLRDGNAKLALKPLGGPEKSILARDD